VVGWASDQGGTATANLAWEWKRTVEGRSRLVSSRGVSGGIQSTPAYPHLTTLHLEAVSNHTP
jgi:hypothetical protein